MKGILFGLLLCIIYTLVYLYLKVPRHPGGLTAFTIDFLTRSVTYWVGFIVMLVLGFGVAKLLQRS
jgi:uncharacterized membrane protein